MRCRGRSVSNAACLVLSAAGEVGVLALLQDRLDRVRVRRPHRRSLAQAQVVQARADRHAHGPVQRVLRVRRVEAVGLRERVLVARKRDRARRRRRRRLHHHHRLALVGAGGARRLRQLDALLLQLVGRQVQRAVQALGELAGLGADGHAFSTVSRLTSSPRRGRLMNPAPSLRAGRAMRAP